tara:strand:- start:19520 stop:21529 length:2010 start_codon:yes stop_codon:yes gene_type:complete
MISIPASSQSLQDLRKMKEEYEKFQKGQSQLQIPSMDEQFIDPSSGIPMQAQIIPNKYNYGYKDSLNRESKFFGHDFFTKRDTIAFWENLPTPSNYILGPGDELIISLWGETQLRKDFTISREGEIYDDKVGILNLMGKTLGEAEKYLLIQFGKVYSTIKGESPTTFMDVSLGKLSSINVNFVGELKFPGVYPLHPFANVITGLIQAGGIDTTASIRNITIKRENKFHAKIDLYNYLINGDLPKNIQLRDQDIVIVPVRKSTIAIDSAVVRPGIYESISGETIGQMINYAGGFKPESSLMIGLKRIIPINERLDNSTNHQNYYIHYDDINTTKVKNGDRLTSLSMFSTVSRVEIIGQVKKPGFYHFYPGMKINDLIQLAGGFNDTTFYKSIYSPRGELVRRDLNNRYDQILEVSLKEIIEGNQSSNINLQNLDRFVIHANINFFERKNIKILGEVNIPGSYSLLNDNETLNSVIERAGGLSSKALENGIAIYRDKKYFEEPPKDKIITKIQSESLQQQNSDELPNFSMPKKIKEDTTKIKLAWQGFGVSLMPGDSIIVKEKVGAVYVAGEVYNSGLVEYQRGKSIRYYLNSAGGINNYGNRNNVVIVYPNGITVPWRFLRSPRVLDGSTIVVYQKADIKPFNATEFASATTSLLSSIVTIMVLSQQLTN